MESEAQSENQRSPKDAVAHLAEAAATVRGAIKTRVVGQEQVVEDLLTTVFASGHALFVGVPGLAKTLLVQTLAKVMSLDTARIQFTPDLMPSDITGTDVLERDQETGERFFRFVKGPIFTQLLLADEVNRTPPKTQSALLEAMSEGRVSAGGTTHVLPSPFLVLATQNPIEQEGTYPLPEAQLDRFLMQINVPYPTPEEELEIVRRTTGGTETPTPSVLSVDELLAFQRLVPTVPVAEHVLEYAIGIVRRSRPGDANASDAAKEFLAFGAGPRAGQSLVLAAKARAVLSGRYAAEREDVASVASAVLRHRLVRSFRAQSQGVGADELIEALLNAT